MAIIAALTPLVSKTRFNILEAFALIGGRDVAFFEAMEETRDALDRFKWADLEAYCVAFSSSMAARMGVDWLRRRRVVSVSAVARDGCEIVILARCGWKQDIVTVTFNYIEKEGPSRWLES